MEEKRDILSLTRAELETALQEMGQPKFRAAQIFRWLHVRRVEHFAEMMDIPATLRERLDVEFCIKGLFVSQRLASSLDDTVKYLYTLPDGQHVECVLMHYKTGWRLCISTQVGCRMGCTFCATGKSGFSRDLTASEMLAQIEAAQRDAGVRISNVVLMGMGEPLDNFDNVVRFLELVGCEQGLNIGMRHITLSTCGLVPKIYELAKLKLQINLAVSLHAPNDEIRARTMPVAKAYPMEQLLKACRDYFDATGRRVTFEYALISGVNDGDACAEELGKKLRGMNCHVNLIPVNSVEGTGYLKSNLQRQQSFANILAAYGVTATVRRTLGSDIDASCGQLRRKYIKN